MTSNKLNSQRQTLAHFWNNGVRSQKELHRITGIPLSTIKYNIQKLKKTGDVAHRRGNGRSKKIGSDKSRELEQYIRPRIAWLQKWSSKWHTNAHCCSKGKAS